MFPRIHTRKFEPQLFLGHMHAKKGAGGMPKLNVTSFYHGVGLVWLPAVAHTKIHRGVLPRAFCAGEHNKPACCAWMQLEFE